MHQNMKNFLETSDTDRHLDIVVDLSIIDKNGYPDFELLINGQKQDVAKNKKNIILEKKLPLLDPIEFTIYLKNKKYSAIKETALVVCIFIENINVLPDYTHLTEYQNDHSKEIQTNYIGYNGTWKFIIDKPFFQWYHYHSSKGILVTPC